ncbi:ABC transporter permease [Campylobacter hyointestinalis subsp. hyointestinalis]|uniref:ABC transport permease n=1 Tax=Campylobacter hyointestinalis subsp. hyointestinalis TaxID=91352 RepID=A0A0S4RNV5_CAMHY|nr:ABC transporter permease [Campylobacter hyointestinalis]PPB58797.1 ABC transporter permease [Campylobacter hyointestinalis subsp. hyointestinalis]PPB69092.1 ABC transporter permease [Campylobacter hyointestinalis subsp. hyointestinalis]QCU00188.1 ABC transporter permease [Campylobacter hyointestinalis subsp. hyointestinalis]CUU67964.1 ABC transport permease [Campylobacter hyointestinalis subsp. hyointestinalis]CUU69446.1 ABC transport permease [Campylobacter hyointestinalis subsp. hyointest
MFIKIISSSILHSQGSKMLAFLTIFLSVTLIACMLNITLNIGDQVARELRSYGSNIVVLPKSQNLSIEIGGKEFLPLKNEDYLKESDLHKIKEIFWRNNITAFAPFLNLKVDGFDVVGTYFDKNINVSDEPDFKSGVESLYPFWVVDGRYPKDDSMSEVLAGDGLGLKVGDTLKLGDINAQVVGVLRSSEHESKKIITSLKLAQSLANKPNLIDKAEVSAMSIPENDLSVKARRDLDSLDSVAYDKWYCSAYVSSIAYQISEEYPNATAKAVLSVSETQSGITKKIQSLMAIASVLSLIVSSICITSLMVSEINRRKKEIGLLKALGATNFIIYMQFVAEIFAVCICASLLGSLAGYALSFVLSYQIFGSFAGISIIVLPLSIFFGFLISVFGSILPLKSVINLLPAEVLYGRK